MRNRNTKRIREHLHALLIVPLVIIIMTWPTFVRVFSGDEFWLIANHPDHWLRFWDAWHLEQVLKGQAEYYYTHAMFHPEGISLTFHGTSLVGSFLLLLLQQLLPPSSAFNLLVLLVLCFNAFSAYVLIIHLISDKWIALFGALAVGASDPFLIDSLTPDLIMIGTLPLTLYFFHRALFERRWRLAALAGLCAGVTVFIGIYIFLFVLMTIGIYSAALALSRWKQPVFWRYLALFIALSSAIGFLRFYPLLADTAVLEEGLARFLDDVTSADVVDHFVLERNPLTVGFLRSVFKVSPDADLSEAYLGYINLVLFACAVFRRPPWRKLLPWLALLFCFATLRLGHFLTINGVEYREVLLPLHFLKNALPALFGQMYAQLYHQLGMILPLAVLSCYGLARLLQSKPAATRALAAILCALILSAEFYTPHHGDTLPRNRTNYVDWLRSEPDGAGAIIDLPRNREYPTFYLYLQTLTDRPQTLGHAHRNPESARGYSRRNFLLRHWDQNRSVHCLPHNESVFIAALDQLLAAGASHIVVHNWLYGDHFINDSFRNTPPAYSDGIVTVYRLSDLRPSCQDIQLDLPQLSHFARSTAVAPGPRTAIISFHPSARIGNENLAYLGSLFSDWKSFSHWYLDDGVLLAQSANAAYDDLDEAAKDSELVYFIYNEPALDRPLPGERAAFHDFELCHRATAEDGSVIEHLLRREFSCALVNADQPLRVVYDNGASFRNAVIEIAEDRLDLYIMWSRLPSQQHSLSLQVFDAAGVKVLGHDFVIDHVSLARHLIDISSLDRGEYAVKLIVYNFNTRVSVPGTVTGTGKRFERSLELAAIERT